MTLIAGTKLGRYEVRSKIGEGGMGEVYLARDLELDRTVAIKILPETLASDQQRLQRFIQEARAASALNHPHILTIYEIGVTGSSRFIATEFIDGETLRQRINSGLNLAEALEIAIQVGSALSAAHAAGEKELAFTWLERGLAAGAIGGFFKNDPVWDPIRGDPRFADLLRRMGIPS